MRIKQAYLRTTGMRTLLPIVPEARATQDLDVFLSLSLFVQRERGAAVRALLNRLQYTEYTPNLTEPESNRADSVQFAHNPTG